MTPAHLRPGLWLALVLVPALVPALASAQTQLMPPPAPASAAARAMEPCDLPPAPGTGYTAAAIVRTACQEHKAWLQPFIDVDGRLASMTVTEAERSRLADDTPAWQRVARYWRESGTLSSMFHIAGAQSCLYQGGGRESDNDCRAYLVDNPWSAAFVSWVMARSPLLGFQGSARHVDYIARAWRDPEGSPYSFADPYASRPAPGDLLCHLRDTATRGPAGLRQALESRQVPQRSHCDIVVGADVAGDRRLYLIGGNVLNAVTMRILPLDGEGRLLAGEVAIPLPVAAPAAEPEPRNGKSRKARKASRTAQRSGKAAQAVAAAPAVPTPAALNPDTTADPSATMRPLSSTDPGHDAATALEAGRCRPGDPAACSFNRRDWVVLLKLKPQRTPGIQLYTPAAAAAASPAPVTTPTPPPSATPAATEP